jgi:hypothetical protein
LGFFVLEYWTPMHLFMSSFEVLHPHCLGPILFASCELQTQTLENLLVHGLCCSSNTKTQLAKWPGVHFPYTILTSPNPSLPLLLYVAASPHAVSAALVQEQDREGTTRQCPVYYVSEVLTTSKCNMTELEKIAYVVVMASCNLRHYFEAFKVRVTSDRRLSELFRNPEASIRITKWAAELSGYHITFEPRTAIKSQVLADFIVDWIGPITQPDMSAEKVWTIHCNGAWCHAGAGAAAVITSPTGVKHRYAARLSFALESDRCTNNVAECEAVILGLRKLQALSVTTCIISTDSKVVVGQVKKDYAAKDPALAQYLTAVRSLERQFKGFTLQHVD